MSLLKRLWSLIVSRTSTAPELAVVEEIEDEFISDPAQTAKIFESLCVSHGVRQRVIHNGGLLRAFVAWYQGPSTEEAISDSISNFREEVEIGQTVFRDWE